MGCEHIGVITLCVLVSGCLTVTPQNFYADELVQKFGAHGALTADQLADLLEAFKSAGTHHHHHSHETSKHPENGHHGECAKASWVDNEHCRKTKCLSSKRVYELYNISETMPLDGATLNTLCPALLYQVQNEGECHNYAETLKDKSAKGVDDSVQVWGFGFLFVTMVNLCSLGGAIVLPFMNKVFYKWLLMFLIALAVGSLAGNAIFCILPDAFGIHDHGPDGEFIWKACVVCAGIYLFFLIERILKMVMDYRMAENEREEIPTVQVDQTRHLLADSFNSQATSNGGSLKTPPNTKAPMHHGCGGGQCSLSAIQLVEDPKDAEANGNNRCTRMNAAGTEVKKTKKQIAPVAWMIIIGDALHNFVDGLSIGAGFTISTLTGISVSIAVVCEELPHELGDFAILLNSGMTKREALGFNFLSSLSCYIGLVIGITVGEHFNASTWIFALAGGMFLYISLVNMMNDVNHATDEEGFKGCQLKLFAIHNLGLLAGFGAMLVLSLYGENISLE